MWLMITRFRPDAVSQAIDAMNQKGYMPKVAVLVDHCRSMYESVRWPESWDVYYSDHHMEFTAGVNWLVRQYPDEKFYGFLGDYVRPRTKGWSIELQAAAGDWNVAYCKDNWMNGKRQDGSGRPHISGALCVGGKLIKELGWMFLPSTVHLYVDDALELIADELKLHRYLDDVVVEVDRPETTGKPRDLNHKRIFNGEHYPPHDKAAFYHWKDYEAPEVIGRIRKRMEQENL